jgi:integrase
VILPRADRVTIAELAEDLKADYKANGRKSADRLEFSLAHLLPFFGTRRAMQLTRADVTTYRAERLEARAAPATINRELAALKRMLSLAVQGERLQRMPYIEMLREDNARRGFFEREQLAAVRRHLPEYAQPAATFAYITGWRLKSEILTLQWRQIDFGAGVVRLEPGTTKNPRAGPATTRIHQGVAEGVSRCWRAGPYPARLPADRGAEPRARGVPRSTAMTMVGHRPRRSIGDTRSWTRRCFERVGEAGRVLRS